MSNAGLCRIVLRTLLRSCVRNRIGKTKTIASCRPVPLHPLVLNALFEWRQHPSYAADLDFLFPSARFQGNKPLSPASILDKSVRPALAGLESLVKESAGTAVHTRAGRPAKARREPKNGMGAARGSAKIQHPSAPSDTQKGTRGSWRDYLVENSRLSLKPKTAMLRSETSRSFVHN
jgi:hypothetical protein